jgi:hypothetical protein|tara:strand:+ start:11290 stop:12138 length:849 start_codon:yes stop_codon:yes gene_type:complete
MAQPSTRQELVDYAKRQLGYPVLEINLADEQIEDLMDDAIQLFQDRHFDGIEKVYMKHKVTQDFIDSIEARGGSKTIGITTSTAEAQLTGQVGITTFTYEENQNFIQIPEQVISIVKVWKIDNRAISTNMFSVNYQLFLNEIYWFTAAEMINYAMTKTFLEDINFLLRPEKQIRYNRRQNRLYIDTDYSSMQVDDYIIIECYRALNPNDYPNAYRDPFLKKYFTALMKKQWGQNLIKFQGVKLPGGVELNGRQIYDDAIGEIEKIEDRMANEYEIPALDMIG